jgi:imidazoleglycerol-phosphate dehydratase
MPRTAEINRTTAETQVKLSLNLDGAGQADVATGVGFLDHMLTLFARHGLMDLTVRCQGDLHVDQHHSVEDVGICLGLAIAQAVGDKRGIVRYGTFTAPMDEALVLVSLDLSGRTFMVCNLDTRGRKIGEFDMELVPEFFHALAGNAKMNLHVHQFHGQNGHHLAEAAFKALGRALDAATRQDPRITDVPSTKGVL